MEKRHIELSKKILQMGGALIEEGENKKDYTISSVGTFMILISGLVYDENDINEFSNLCAMFSAKKLIDSQTIIGNISEGDLNNFKENRNDIYKNIIKLMDELEEDDNEDDEDC